MGLTLTETLGNIVKLKKTGQAGSGRNPDLKRFHMKIRLDDVMQSFSYPFNAVYYYYIPLETVLMFVRGAIYGKAVHGISTLEDVRRHKEDFIRLPEIGDEGRRKVMMSFLDMLGDVKAKKRLRETAEEGVQSFENALGEERLLLTWYNYRDDIYREFSLRWGKENGLDIIG